MRLAERARRREADIPSNHDGLKDEWEVGPQPHPTAIILIAIGMASVLVVATVVIAFPSLIQNYLAPPPLWHSFTGVFSPQGNLASEGCSLYNLTGYVGLGGIPGPGSTVTCSYHGGSYVGHYGKNCNLSPTGPIPAINGTLIPFDGCVLSTAPLNKILTNIFTLSSKATNKSIEIWSNHRLIANMTPTADWKGYHCSLVRGKVNSSNGPLDCIYLGIPYVASSVIVSCNLGTPIQVNGVPVPPGSCNFQRSETVTG